MEVTFAITCVQDIYEIYIYEPVIHSRSLCVVNVPVNATIELSFGAHQFNFRKLSCFAVHVTKGLSQGGFMLPRDCPKVANGLYSGACPLRFVPLFPKHNCA